MCASNVRRKDIRNQVRTEFLFRVDERDFAGSILVEPSTDNSPASGEDCGRVVNQADTQSFGIVTGEEPNEIFDQWVIHTSERKVLQIKDDTEIVNHIFE